MTVNKDDEDFREWDADLEQSFVPPDPLELKNLGNRAFADGEVTRAIDLWKACLKAALKLSVRNPSKALLDLQMQARMNLALGFCQEEDFIMAKEHALVVFENQEIPSAKVCFRLAEIYLALRDHDHAQSIVENGLRLHSNEKALLVMRQKILTAKRDSNNAFKAQLKKRIGLDKLNDDRAEPGPTVEKFNLEPFTLALSPDSQDSASLRKLCNSLIAWRHRVDQPLPNEMVSDLDDWEGSPTWLLPYTAERLVDDRTVIHVALPLSICLAIENIIRWIPAQGLDSISYRKQILQGNEPLPQLGKVRTPNLLNGLRTKAVEWITRTQVVPMPTPPFTIHVIGCRGDVEMDCKWAAILDRLPFIDILQVVMIGFIDENDAYNQRLAGEEYFSPPLSKKSGLRETQKFIARLYKGTYQNFIRSKLVYSALGKEMPTSNDGLYSTPEILLNEKQMLHPDLAVIAEPNFSRHFESWAPAIADLILAHIPILFLGHSVVQGPSPSHEALGFASILPHFGAKFELPLYWNPFSVIVKPSEELPSMPIVDQDGVESQYTSLSAKYAVACVVCGVDDTDLVETSQFCEKLVKIASDETFMKEWKSDLEIKFKLDVDRERRLAEVYAEDTRESAAARDALIKENSRKIIQKLKASTKGSKTTPRPT